MKQKLRTGFTTGTAAAAATKAALLFILEGKKPSKVQIRLLTGDDITIPINRCKLKNDVTASCSVIKDAGDDPDVTHKAEIGAIVALQNSDDGPSSNQRSEIIITGGEGVGRVTKPGLEVAPGEAAINPGPRKMIEQAAGDVLTKYGINRPVSVEVFVPQGKKIAEKTLNARLGILGGISILGTTGIVQPMSHDAFIATIESALSVARAAGHKRVVLTTGRRSERFARHLWPRLPEDAFVQIGDFFKMSLKAASLRGFKRITLAVFFGKAVKMAQGIPHTHAAKSRLTLNALSQWAFQISCDRVFSKRVSSAHTARHAFDIICDHCPEVISYVGRRIIESANLFAGKNVKIQAVVFDYNGNIAFNSEKFQSSRVKI